MPSPNCDSCGLEVRNWYLDSFSCRLWQLDGFTCRSARGWPGRVRDWNDVLHWNDCGVFLFLKCFALGVESIVAHNMPFVAFTCSQHFLTADPTENVPLTVSQVLWMVLLMLTMLSSPRWRCTGAAGIDWTLVQQLSQGRDFRHLAVWSVHASFPSLLPTRRYGVEWKIHHQGWQKGGLWDWAHSLGWARN